MSEKLDNYVEKGLYGAKQTKRAERRLYLGTLRERIVLALTKKQVRKKEGFDRLEKEMQMNKAANLLLNGELSYRFLTDYKKLATRYGIEYTTIFNKKTETDMGVILTYEQAIDKEDIFFTPENQTSNLPENEQSGFFYKIKSFFKNGR